MVKERKQTEKQLLIKRLESLKVTEQLTAINKIQYPPGSVGGNFKNRGTLVREIQTLLSENTIEGTLNELNRIQ